MKINFSMKSFRCLRTCKGLQRKWTIDRGISIGYDRLLDDRNSMAVMEESMIMNSDNVPGRFRL